MQMNSLTIPVRWRQTLSDFYPWQLPKLLTFGAPSIVQSKCHPTASGHRKASYVDGVSSKGRADGAGHPTPCRQNATRNARSVAVYSGQKINYTRRRWTTESNAQSSRHIAYMYPFVYNNRMFRVNSSHSLACTLILLLILMAGLVAVSSFVVVAAVGVFHFISYLPCARYMALVVVVFRALAQMRSFFGACYKIVGRIAPFAEQSFSTHLAVAFVFAYLSRLFHGNLNYVPTKMDRTTYFILIFCAAFSSIYAISLVPEGGHRVGFDARSFCLLYCS